MSFGNNSNTKYLWGCSVKPYSIVGEVADKHVVEVFHFDRLTDKILGVVLNCVLTGACGSIGGKASYFYTILCRKFNLPATYIAPDKYMLLAREWRMQSDVMDTINAVYHLGKRQLPEQYVAVPEFLDGLDPLKYIGCRIPVQKVRDIIADRYRDLYAGSIEQAKTVVMDSGTVEFSHNIYGG